MKQIKYLFLIMTCLASAPSYGAMGHYYETQWLSNLFMLDNKDWHTKIYGFLGHGWANESRDALGQCVPLLDIFGPQNLLDIFQGVPEQASVSSLRTTANNLRAAAAAGDAAFSFGKLSFAGKFNMNIAHLMARQNIKYGFYGFLHVPIRQLTTDDIVMSDLSPTEGTFSTENSDWVTLKNNLNTILSAYGYKPYQDPMQMTGFGDLAIAAGWQGICHSPVGSILDLLSLQLQAGILCPTGRSFDGSEPFSLMQGHLHHWAFLGLINGQIGLSEKLRFGGYFSCMRFADKKARRRMRTAATQTGYMRLAAGNVQEKLGNRFSTGGYMVLMPPFLPMLHLVLAYTYEWKHHATLYPEDRQTFSFDIVNTPNLARFKAHVFHLRVHYPFDHMNKWFVPSVEFFWDKAIGGEHIYKGQVVGGGIGLNFNWEY